MRSFFQSGFGQKISDCTRIRNFSPTLIIKLFTDQSELSVYFHLLALEYVSENDHKNHIWPSCGMATGGGSRISMGGGGQLIILPIFS